MTGEEKVWVAEGSLGLVRAVRATYFFARITAFFTGDAVGCQKTVMLFSRPGGASYKNHKLIKTAPTPGQQKATPAYQEQHKACTSFYETASRTSGTRRSSSGRPCTSNISGTGLALSRRRDILFPFAAMAPKARRRLTVEPPRPVELE